MKVLHVITDSFSANSFVAPLAQYQRRRGWQVAIVCSGKSFEDAHPYIDEMRAAGLEVVDISIPRRVDPIGDVAAAFQLNRVLRAAKPDIVHTHLAKAGIIGRATARMNRVPVVHTVYDYAFFDSGGVNRLLYREGERIAARWCSRIMFISQLERAISERERIGLPAQYETIGFGIDLDRFNPAKVNTSEVAELKRRFGIPTSRRVIGTLCRLVPRKQVHWLIRVFAELKSRMQDTHLLIAGGGPIQDDLMRVAADLGVADSTTFTGFIDDDSMVPVIYASMDVFCLLSRREGYGMAVAEAGAMQRPVVVNDIDPINLIVKDGETGFLVGPYRMRQPVDAIAAILEAPELAARMGQAAAEFVAVECNLRDRFASIVSVYEDVLGLRAMNTRT